MMRISKAAFVACTGFALSAGLAAADGLSITKLSVPDMSLGGVAFPGGKTLNLTVGIGSAAYVSPKEGGNTLYALTDRGPNIDCKVAQKVVGVPTKNACADDAKARIFPIPSFTPSIYKFDISATDTKIAARLPLKGKSGKPISGLPNLLVATDTDGAYSEKGASIPLDPSGVDTEGLVKLSDGTFWAAEEYGGSILHIGADGTILSRHVPAGLEKDLAKADYPVKGSLPAIIATRKLNRGIESLAVSADEKFLYFVMQSPLCNPNCKAYKNSLNARLFKFDIGQSEAVGQYLYLMDAPASFAADNKKKKRKKSDVKLSEMVTVGKDRLLVLERISETTKFYIVDLNGANTVPAKFDRRTTKPSLEQIEPAGFSGAGLTPLKKTLVLNTDNHKGFPSKIEGIGLIGEKEMLLVNDNDFGITGRKTQILRVKFDEAVLK